MFEYRYLWQEWEWPNSADGELRLGTVGTSSTRRVGASIHNTAPSTLCVPEYTLELAGATLALQPCAHLRAPPPKHACVSSAPPARPAPRPPELTSACPQRCLAAGERMRAVLTVVAPAREGELGGSVSLWAAPPRYEAPPSLTRLRVSLTARAGRVLALPLPVLHAAPVSTESAARRGPPPSLTLASVAVRVGLGAAGAGEQHVAPDACRRRRAACLGPRRVFRVSRSTWWHYYYLLRTVSS